MDRATAGGVTRRRALAALASGGSVAASGCIGRIRSMSGWESPTRVRLEITTVPADADPYALRLARQVSEWFRAAGVDARVTPVSRQELFRRVLLDREFDAFVTRPPTPFRTPDSLYSLLHSRFAEEAGWQNPFGYANLGVDELLETQRRTTGSRRREAVAELQRRVARTQPFSVLANPDDIRAARTDRFGGWRGADLGSSTGYLSLARSDEEASTDDGPATTEGSRTADRGEGSGASSDATTLRTATTDRRATGNLNPLAVEFRRNGVMTGLLYDSLGYVADDGTVEPWLAESWAFSGTDSRPVARATLRPDASWHDGEPLTAGDVAFTYDLLTDTTLDESGDSGGDGSGTGTGGGGSAGTGTTPVDDGSVPAPRFQGRNSLVDEARAVDDRTVELRFVECAPEVATRAFTVPVLPEHVWADRTEPVSIGGISFGPATEALVTNNVPPVGSGPLRFVRNTPRESLVLERNDEHFLVAGDASDLPAALADGPAFDRLSMQVAGSDVSAVEAVAGGDADVTDTPVGAETVPRIGRADRTDLLVDERSTPYVLGYNTQVQPLTNPQIRHTLARLIHRPTLVGEVFDGYARASVSPLSGTGWVPSDLRWDGEDPVTPFIGSGGEVDASRAREAFRRAGYSYDDGRLVRNGG